MAKGESISGDSTGFYPAPPRSYAPGVRASTPRAVRRRTSLSGGAAHGRRADQRRRPPPRDRHAREDGDQQHRRGDPEGEGEGVLARVAQDRPAGEHGADDLRAEPAADGPRD